MATPAGAQHRDLEQRLRDMERQVQALTSALLHRRQQNVTEGDFVVSGGGDVIVRDGGAIKALHDNGTNGVHYGGLVSEGTEIPTGVGLLVQTETGSDIARFGTTATPDGSQAIIRDRNERPIVYDDGPTGFGLGAPFLPVPLWKNGSSNGYTNSTTTYETAYLGDMVVQFPYLRVYVKCYAGATDEGQVRVLLNGAVAGAAQTIPNGGTFLTFTIPLHTAYAHNSTVSVEVQCRKLSGSNAVTIIPVECRGDNS